MFNKIFNGQNKQNNKINLFNLLIFSEYFATQELLIFKYSKLCVIIKIQSQN